MFSHLLCWYTVYVLGGLLPLTEFCHVQNSLCIQVLPSLILAALLHSTWAVGVTNFAAWYKEWNYKTFVPRYFSTEGANYILRWHRHCRRHPIHLMNADGVPGVHQPSNQTNWLGLWVGFYHPYPPSFFITARRNARIASAVLAIAIPSVCPSVHHTPVLCQNDGT